VPAIQKFPLCLVDGANFTNCRTLSADLARLEKTPKPLRVQFSSNIAVLAALEVSHNASIFIQFVGFSFQPSLFSTPAWEGTTTS